MKPEHLFASLSALEAARDLPQAEKMRKRIRVLKDLSAYDRQLVLQAEYLKQSSQKERK